MSRLRGFVEAAATMPVRGWGPDQDDPAGIFMPFVERFGHFDGVADSAIGEERSRYYRASYHTRRYIRETWTRYFDLLDVLVMGHSFTQDYVVLRK